MVPGDIGVQEVGRIAQFIDSLNQKIPCGLLAFHPDCKITDSAVTFLKQARERLDAATQAELERTRFGAIHLPG